MHKATIMLIIFFAIFSWQLIFASLSVADGLVLHLDADSITRLSNGDPVAIWTDLSDASNNGTQATPASHLGPPETAIR